MIKLTADTHAWQQLQQRLGLSGQRRLVLLEGEREQGLAWLAATLPALNVDTALWVGPAADNPASHLIPLAATAARQWLGREIELLVWDGWSGNPPDSLAALSGTLSAGGLWFWLVPPLSQWAGFDDPDYRRTGLADNRQHPFARRLADCLRTDHSVIRLDLAQSRHRVLPQLPVPAQPFLPGVSTEQQRLIDAIVTTGLGRRRRPLVMTADRGRGKSAALGLAAIQLLRQGRRQLIVTAPSAAAVATLFHHARAEAGAELVPDHDPHSVRLAQGQSLRFLPLDELLQQRPEAELVLVDEAAAIPAQQLKEILLGWPRCVFASTIHGYEGTGRGFSIRFRDVLDRHTPQWRAETVSQPIRWAADDPLEALTARLFLLDASAPEPAPDTDPGAIQIARWQPATASDQELTEAFGLLVDAHYRTTPGDLRQWLDDAGAVTWRASCNGVVVGVLWASREGGLAPDLAEQVMQGKRRLRGHLLPQSLASHSGFVEAASLHLLRIVRVAVAAGARRQGIGHGLVQAALGYAREQRLDGLGTSFGASPELLAFWRQCRLPLVRLGLHRESSSGEHAVQLLQGLSAPGQALVSRVRERLAEHWTTLVPSVWAELAPELVLTLTAELPPRPPLGPQDLCELRAFAEGYRGFELSLPVLRAFSGQAGMARQLASETRLWVRAVLQGWDWTRLQRSGDCRGRRDAEQRLRTLVRRLLPLLDGD
ncbi:tRNA(Met) cytidine acetyltransferase TmcA [Marinobacter sp. SS21]|uniref:tRNA(Met) cytidine acetyltransferase TmcA n=1 Tax=Marinobacter sp. SS21 TaxID=2979460 RepID=UPI00232C5D59|nr:GNAT family N-acetyltransferase [Marinobacter sp. SS21]MDC0663001.1 GNAT family N-acetyltransferase [Marinobacter sp. SS21]